MTNEQRAYIWRHLLSQYRMLCSEPEVNEETARNAVCDILLTPTVPLNGFRTKK